MADRIKQILLRSTVWIMTTDTRIGTRLDPLVGHDETIGLLIVTRGTKLTEAHAQQCILTRPMSVVAGRTVLSSRLMQGTVTPEGRHFTMASQAQSWLVLTGIA